MSDAIVSGSPKRSLEGVTHSSHFSPDELFEFGFDAAIEGLKVKLLHATKSPGRR